MKTYRIFTLLAAVVSLGFGCSRANNTYIYLDNQGRTAIKGPFYYASEFSDGIAAVRFDNSGDTFLIDEAGHQLKMPHIKAAGRCEAGKIPASPDGKKWGVLSVTGEWLIQPKYSLVALCDNGRVILEERVLVQCDTNQPPAGSSGLKELTASSGREDNGQQQEQSAGMLNNSAKKVWKSNISIANVLGVMEWSVKGVDVCYYAGENRYCIGNNGYFMLFDEHGISIGTNRYDYSVSFREGLACVRLAHKDGCIDVFGRLVIPYAFDELSPFHCGLSVAGKGWPNRRFGYIDRHGNIVMDFQFENARDFSEGLAAVSKNGKYGYIDVSGHNVIDFKYDLARDFHDGVAAVKIGKLYGFIDSHGREVIQPSFERVDDFHNNRIPIRLSAK